jgi:hypothetical protein
MIGSVLDVGKDVRRQDSSDDTRDKREGELRNFLAESSKIGKSWLIKQNRNAFIGLTVLTSKIADFPLATLSRGYCTSVTDK